MVVYYGMLGCTGAATSAVAQRVHMGTRASDAMS